jgi:hypothetical protein
MGPGGCSLNCGDCRPDIRKPRKYPPIWPISKNANNNKSNTQAHLKGSGIQWADQHVNSILALRNIVCSRRWKEDWPKIEKRLRQRASPKKQKLH